MTTKRQPWDRLEGETPKAYQGFSEYLKLPTNERNQQKVAETIKKQRPTVSEWSSRYHWVERAAAYDEYFIRAEREAEEQGRLKAISELKRRHAKGAQAAWDVAMAPIREVHRRLNRDTGRLAALEKLNDVELLAAVKDAATMFKEAVKIERLSNDLPTDNVAMRGQVEHTHIVDDTTRRALARIAADPALMEMAERMEAAGREEEPAEPLRLIANKTG